MSGFTKAQKRKAWLIWTLCFVPTFGVAMFAIERFGFWRVMPIIMMILTATLLYQRYVKGRSWQSILWGDQKMRDSE
jgi:hypothetical protein